MDSYNLCIVCFMNCTQWNSISPAKMLHPSQILVETTKSAQLNIRLPLIPLQMTTNTQTTPIKQITIGLCNIGRRTGTDISIAPLQCSVKSLSSSSVISVGYRQLSGRVGDTQISPHVRRDQWQFVQSWIIAAVRQKWRFLQVTLHIPRQLCVITRRGSS